MGDFVALYEGDEYSSTASATITGGQILEVSGDATVAPTSGASTKVVGAAGFDCVNGDRITVLYHGIVVVTASGGITAGDTVTSAAAGKVATAVAATAAAAGTDIGVALTTATDGNPVRIKFRRT